ncbi:hypothetical protein P9314_11040 [Paenibacillus validus]|uniref:hypothetical protein n=1 Tax=Paenibacillus validus TaxID=44253 RepID=UPI000FD9190A|nr:hypothetical protein [Paenibacillus validus]MED4601240.1 hypothetical protein [Paenibacillus validus]MED4607500.1 hypothetical protein [Paenibacillus validus]
MSIATVSIEPETGNFRTNQITFRLVINNTGSEKVKLTSLVPIVPEGVVLEERADSFQESTIERYNDLCTHMTELIRVHLQLASEETRLEVIKVTAEELKTLINLIPNLMKLYIYIIKQTFLKSEQKKYIQRYQTFQFKITSLNDATWAYNKWFSDDRNLHLKELYEGKLYQLKELAEAIGTEKSRELAIIEPNSFYSRSYVIKCKSKLFSERIINIAADINYLDSSNQNPLRATSSKTVTIHPKSASLTFVSMISSILGTILHFTQTSQDSEKSFWVSIIHFVWGQAGISAVITSFFVFSIIEYLDIMKKSPIRFGWQLAMLIGFLSGFMVNRLIEAIKVFVGFQ